MTPEREKQLVAELARLSRENHEARAALQMWKCPACGGSGFYSGFSKGAPEGRPCSKCSGNGLHPVAAAALGAPKRTIEGGDHG